MPISRFSDLNWRRGFAEVSLIFIGITLALLFDNWNGARKDRILEEQLLAALRADLIETRADLVTDIEEAENRARNTRELIDVIVSDVPPENSGREIRWRVIGTSRLFKKNFAYRALVAQGLDSITNWQIVKATTDLYELYLTRVAYTENSAFSVERRVLEQLYPHMNVPAETLESLRSEKITAQLLHEAPIEIADWEAMHTDRELVHWLMELLKRTQAAEDFYLQAQSRLDEIVAMIDEEIGDRS
jgi:hypothetical protein